MGTGGTISGVGRYLKEQNPNVKVIAVDPHGSILRDYFYTKKTPQTFKTYQVEGIGQDFVPGTLHYEFIDDILEISDKESFLTARRLAREEGILAGGSCGTAMAGALKVAEQLTAQHVIVVLLPDTGERYLTKMYNDDWMRENRFLVPERITNRFVVDAKHGITGVISIGPSDTVRKALDLLNQHNISQLPVLEGGKSVGSIEESELMSTVLANPAAFDAPVRDYMKQPFPKVHADELISQAVSFLTKRQPAVLVEDKEQLIGILTRYDVIEYMSR
jgi:cystathionine beta-synthase